MTLTQLVWTFERWLTAEVRLGHLKPATQVYYQQQLPSFVRHVGPATEVSTLRPAQLTGYPKTWHRVQAIQRLFNWALALELIDRNPFRTVVKPPPGQRERVLTEPELLRLLRRSPPLLRAVLFGQRYTIARPQEVRGLVWSQYRPDLGGFVLTRWKAQKRRRDGLCRRLLPVAPRLARLLERLRRHNPLPTDYVFTNSLGRPWTGNALRIAVAKAAELAGLQIPGEERVVAYTLRHTAATEATARGVRDRLLADIMGHVSTRTTARYQHLDGSALVEGIVQATTKRRRKVAA